MAILSGDSKTISKAQGIGNKTAQRIIIELKDKLKNQDLVDKKKAIVEKNTLDDEALVALGYSQSDAFNAVKKVKDTNVMDVEELLKLALKNMI